MSRAQVIPIRAADDRDAKVIAAPDVEQIKAFTAQTAREICDTLDKFTDREAREMLVRCALHTYHAQRIGRM